jgi:hypothetical protein
VQLNCQQVAGWRCGPPHGPARNAAVCAAVSPREAPGGVAGVRVLRCWANPTRSYEYELVRSTAVPVLASTAGRLHRAAAHSQPSIDFSTASVAQSSAVRSLAGKFCRQIWLGKDPAHAKSRGWIDRLRRC